jgi:hypothetical protein
VLEQDDRGRRVDRRDPGDDPVDLGGVPTRAAERDRHRDAEQSGRPQRGERVGVRGTGGRAPLGGLPQRVQQGQ